MLPNAICNMPNNCINVLYSKISSQIKNRIMREYSALVLSHLLFFKFGYKIMEKNWFGKIQLKA